MHETGVNQQIFLKHLPEGKLEPDHFEFRETAIPAAATGELLLRTLYLSIDAAQRAWMRGATYRDAMSGGQLMSGWGVLEVVQSNHRDFLAGDIVTGSCGWQTYCVRTPDEIQQPPPAEPLSQLLSVFGLSGRTAYLGMVGIGEPDEGDTVVVSAAAGSVGLYAVQLASLRGARVVAIAGSDDKCHWLVHELGCSAAVNHRAPDFREALRAACPDGVDVYFDNTGGDIAQSVLSLLNTGARFVCCGTVSGYDGGDWGFGLRGVPGVLVAKRIRMQGFIVGDDPALLAEADTYLRGAVARGDIQVVDSLVNGLHRAPHALIGLLAGDNIGKRIVRVNEQ